MTTGLFLEPSASTLSFTSPSVLSALMALLGKVLPAYWPGVLIPRRQWGQVLC